MVDILPCLNLEPWVFLEPCALNLVPSYIFLLKLYK